MNRNSVQTIGAFALTWLIVAALVLSMFPTAPRAFALEDPCALDPNNLFYNGTMAPPEHSTPYGTVADGWTHFIYAGLPPQFDAVDNEGIDNGYSQQIFAINTFDAGIQQTVPNLQIGVNYWFRLGYSLAAKSYGGDNVRVNTIGRKVGVDPFGGTDPHSSNVLWGPDLFDGNAALNRPEMTFVFTARATSATIFLRAMATDGSGGENRVWFDALCMEARPDLPPTTPPSPGSNKTFFPLVLSNSSACAPTNLATISVGTHPKGVAADPTTNRVFVSLYDDSSVAVVDAATNQKIASWGTSSTGHSNGIGVANGRVFVALRDAASVAILNATTGAFVAHRAAGALPYGVGGASNRVWIANFSADSVTLLDAATTNAVTTTNAGSHSNPALVVASGDRAFVSLWGSGVAEVANDGALLHNFTSPGAGAFGVAFNATTNRLYVSNRDTKQVLMLDPSTGSVLKSVTLTQSPYALAVNPNTNHLFVVLAESNQVDVRDGATLERVALLSVGTQGDDGGDGIAVMSDRVYVANNAAGTVSVIVDCQ
jgi:DNA-binding beta-propeller fold protein YncE